MKQHCCVCVQCLKSNLRAKTFLYQNKSSSFSRGLLHANTDDNIPFIIKCESNTNEITYTHKMFYQFNCGKLFFVVDRFLFYSCST